MALLRDVRHRHHNGAIDRYVLCAIVAFGLVGAGLAFRNLSSTPKVEVKETPAVARNTMPETQDSEQLPKDWVTLGGIARPATDVNRKKLDSKSGERPIVKKLQGHSPFLALDASPEVASVAAAHRDASKAEQYSSFVVPTSFDASKFASDPKEYGKQYAKAVEPGRVFASAQPSESVSAIVPSGATFHRVKQGEAVRLSAKVLPSAPVTFTSFNLGQFDNLLTSSTVVADDSGVATANFTASGGTINQVSILAASPVTSGQIAFTVQVSVPSTK